MAKLSIKAAVRDAKREDKALRAPKLVPLRDGTEWLQGATTDSFQNFAQKLGVGADNPLTTGSYGFNPITRNRTLLEWIHRGSWLGGVAIDIVADDMTRAGIEIDSGMEPDDEKALHEESTALEIWDKTNETIKWARLYGGAIAVMLINGQDFSTPLRLDTVGKDQFKGLLVLDRWMVDPALEDLVTDIGPDLGLPKYYRVQSNAPALRGKTIHYTRIAFRLLGIQLPYQQRLTENLWGISVIERLYDRMIAFDGASTGVAQLVYKAYLRTLKVKGLREVVSMGGEALTGLVAYTDLMRRYQGMEGVTLIDGDDEYGEHGAGQAFSGLGDALSQLALQLSGALQIPLTRLFGQSPAGFSDGDNDVRNYFDHINQRQNKDLLIGITKCYVLMSQSLGIEIPEGFMVKFKTLWQMNETDKATVAKSTTDSVVAAVGAGLIADQTALQELKQSSRTTGLWSNITAQQIKAADDVPTDPMEMMPVDPSTGLPMPPDDQGGSDDDDAGNEGGLPKLGAPNGAGTSKPQGKERKMAKGKGSGEALLKQA